MPGGAEKPRSPRAITASLPPLSANRIARFARAARSTAAGSQILNGSALRASRTGRAVRRIESPP